MSDSANPAPEDLARLQHEVGEMQLPDPILRMLVSVCNRGALTFTLTVAHGGLLISGTAVGVARFMQDVAAELEARGTTDAEVLADPLRYLARLATDADAGEDLEDLPIYLHLEHARVRSGDAVIAEDVRWRARLCDVDGWSLGDIAPDS